MKYLKQYIMAGAVLSVVGFAGCVYALLGLYNLVGGVCSAKTDGCKAFTSLHALYLISQTLVIGGAVIVLMGLILLHLQKQPKKRVPRK